MQFLSVFFGERGLLLNGTRRLKAILVTLATNSPVVLCTGPMFAAVWVLQCVCVWWGEL